MRALIVLFCLLLSGCYSREMVLEDSWGLPLQAPRLSLTVEADGQPERAARFRADLSAVLPRERFVQVVAADPQTPRLQIQLRERHQAIPVMANFWSPQVSPPPRTRMEIQLEARLHQVDGTPTGEPLVLVQRGEASPEALAVLESQLLEALRHRLLQELQPRYRYR